MFYDKKNVFVAGGAGMVGQSLIPKLLERGAYVRATQYRRGRIALSHKNLKVVDCDLRQTESAWSVLKDMDVVFLCAGVVRGAKWIKEDPASIFLYNLDLLSKLIHLASKAKVQRVGFISSSYIYPDTGRSNVEEEGFQGDPWKPMNYGIGWTYRYLETLCKHFHMTSFTDYAVARPTAIYGPHDHFDLEEGHAIPALIVKAVSRMEPFEVWGNGEDVRCFTYVDDFSEGLLMLTEKFAVAEPLNICSRDANTIKDVVRILLSHLDFHSKVVFQTDKPSVVPYKVSDPGRAKELIKWEAEVSLEEGLKRTMDWYVEQSQGAREELVPGLRI